MSRSSSRGSGTRPDTRFDTQPVWTRRSFLGHAALGIAAAGLPAVGAPSASRARELEIVEATGPPLPPGAPHFAPKARHVIFLFMVGGPSQIDLFDDKPLLRDRNGQPIPESFVRGERFAFIRGTPRLIGSPYRFARHGASGAEISELLPETAGIADRIAIVRSMHTNQFNHGPGQIMMSTGHQRIGRPSLGAWLSYGLGGEAEGLPAFAVMLSGDADPDGGAACWGSGFLPSEHQGVKLDGSGSSLHFLAGPAGVDRRVRGREIDAMRALNEAALARAADPEIEGRIAATELGFEMQETLPALLDLSTEPAHVMEAYGAQNGVKSFATHCVIARRLVESGTRCVQLFHRGWDHHGAKPGLDIVAGLIQRCRETDRAAAALVRDLDQRGLLDETLVVWGGEFGRTPINEERYGSKLAGRDHHPHAFTMWMAGGGIRPGVTLGRTDEFGYEVVEDPVSVHDLHATILHLLGLDHTRLTYLHRGRHFRLTDVHGRVVEKILG